VTSLTGKVAIVTGASRGIGLAIAKALVREGVRLGLLSRSRPAVPGDFVSCDFADLEQIPAAVGQLVERLGTVDFLINNAGTFLEKPTPGLPLADWERVQRVNLTAPFLITREVLPRMITRQQGRIIKRITTLSRTTYGLSATAHGSGIPTLKSMTSLIAPNTVPAMARKRMSHLYGRGAAAVNSGAVTAAAAT
jgi:NAD(P)-dependent dehydrogenase (short-subunit alcohol dehydrogenase family)